MDIQLYKQSLLKAKNGTKIYFIPLIINEQPRHHWGCVKYGDTDIPSFEQLRINELEKVKDVKMHKDMSEYIIKQFFENKTDQRDIILGYEQGR